MKRIVLVLIIVGMLGAAVVGGLWYVRRNSGNRLLARAELALRAQKYGRAADLARKHVDAKADDWRGYYALARAHTALGRYDEARAVLEDAIEIAPRQVDLVRLRANTFAYPAREALGSEDPALPLNAIRGAIADLEKARDALEAALAPEAEPMPDLAETLALTLTDLYAARTRLAYRLQREADTAAEVGAADQAETKRQAADAALERADQEAARAVALLLKGITSAVARATEAEPPAVSSRAAETLVRLCLRRDDAEALDAAREAILGMDDPPPLAATMLILNDLGPLGETSASEAGRQSLEAAAAKLDRILEKHPDHPDILQTQLARSRLALRLDDIDAAGTFADAILEDLPRQRDARLIRALVTMERGQVGEAEKALFALKTDHPHWPPAHYAYAQAAIRAGKDELAREALRRVTALAPNHAGARTLLAQGLLEDGFAEAALAEVQALRASEPGNPAGLRLLVASAAAAGQTGLAVDTLAAAETTYPDDPAMQAAIAEGYARLGEAEKAAGAAEKIVASEPRTLRDRLIVAQALMRLGKRGEAEATLAEIARANPRSPGAHFLLGSVYFDTGRTLQAIEAFRTAVDLVPQASAYRLALARALLRANLVEEAREQVDAVLTRDPGHADAALLASQLAALLGESSDTDALLEGGLTGRSGRTLALAHLVQGAPEKAADVCRALLDDTPDDADALWLLGRAYLAMDDEAACRKHWTSALKVRPDDLRYYQHLAILLARERPIAEVETALAVVEGARSELVHMATASLLQRLGNHEAAAEAYGRVAEAAEVDEALRTVARVQRGRCLAEAGHGDLAALEFDRVPAESPLYGRAQLAKAAVLGSTGRADEANRLLASLHEAAAAEGAWSLVRRVGTLYLRTNQAEKALAVAEGAAAAAPTDPEPLMLQAAALTRLGRLDEAVQCYRDAVALQPGHLALHLRLAETLDQARRRSEALEALEALAEQGETGRGLALFQRGVLLSRWGLQAQAIAALTTLADSEAVTTPRVRLALGRALAALGEEETARQQLLAVPAYAEEYVEARQALAALAGTPDAKLAVLREAETAHPAPAFVVQRLAVLLQSDQPAEAVAAFEAHVADLEDGALPAPRVASAGLQAMLASGAHEKAAELAARVARGSGDTRWRYVAALLAVQTDPTTAAALLPPSDQASLFDALLGLCVAARTGGHTGPWAARVDWIRQQAADRGNGRAVPVSYRVLAALVGGDAEAAKSHLAGSEPAEPVAPAAMRELIGRGDTDAVRREAVTLLAATIAAEVGLADLSRGWAMAALEARPEAQWAAALAARGVEDADRLRAVAEAVKPADCVTARALRVSALRLAGKYAEAAEAAEALADAHPDVPDLRMIQAMACEGAGRLEAALPLYQAVWKATANPVAANNAAYLVSVLYPKDPAKLQEAFTLAEAAVEAAPGVGAFRDTCGWVAFLLGRHHDACRHLRTAIKGNPDSPEIHCHLGLAEQQAGHADLARWHLEAALATAEAMAADGRPLPKPVAEAVQLARAALADLQPPAEP